MDWQALLTTLGGTGILVAAMVWLSKRLIESLLSKNLERYKGELKAQNDVAIEQLKSSLQMEAQKRAVEFTSLHEKRASIIADLYTHLYNMQGLIQMLHFEYQHREIREDIDRKIYLQKREEWKLEPGIDTLRPDEEQLIKKISDETKNFYEFYKRNRIYFTAEVCNLIDRFATLTSYLAFNYHNVALKDKEGNLLVNPRVKEVWDKALETIPKLLEIVEAEFRNILGVA